MQKTRSLLEFSEDDFVHAASSDISSLSDGLVRFLDESGMKVDRSDFSSTPFSSLNSLMTIQSLSSRFSLVIVSMAGHAVTDAKHLQHKTIPINKSLLKQHKFI